jgi:hypothetical protein
MNEHSRWQCLILICSAYLTTDLCVLLHVIAEISIQLHFPEVLLQYFFLWGGVVSFMPNPQPGGPGYPVLPESSPLACMAREALPVAYGTTTIAQWRMLGINIT